MMFTIYIFLLHLCTHCLNFVKADTLTSVAEVTDLQQKK